MSFAQEIATHSIPITSPILGPKDELFTIAANGDIYRYNGVVEYDTDLHPEIYGTSTGQPSGLVFAGLENQELAYICDAAHQAIFQFQSADTEDGTRAYHISPYVTDYDQSHFVGPNSMCYSRKTGMLYFTDGGAFGETSIQNPRGSVFAINPDTKLLIPLILNTLAQPCGIALSPDGKHVYVCETGMNRILRLSQSPPTVYHCSVFHQLSGRYGPTAIAVSEVSGDLYVAHFDFQGDNARDGKVLVIDPNGTVTLNLSLNGIGSEITGLCLIERSGRTTHLVVTERSSCSVYRQALL